MIVILSVLAVLVVLGMFAFSLFVLLRNRNAVLLCVSELFSQFKKRFFPTPLGKLETEYSEYVIRGGQKGRRVPGHTVVLPHLVVEQLDPKTLKTVEQFLICGIPEYGLSISRPDSPHGDIVLRDYSEEAFTVSEDHARILQDEDGFYLQDSGSRNLLYVRGARTPCDEVAIGDGLIVYLGKQPIRFSIPNPFDSDLPGQTRVSPYGGIDPDEAEPVTYRESPRRRRGAFRQRGTQPDTRL